MYEREEVNDEIQGLATQEIAKIKHMVKSFFRYLHNRNTYPLRNLLRVHWILVNYFKS